MAARSSRGESSSPLPSTAIHCNVASLGFSKQVSARPTDVRSRRAKDTVQTKYYFSRDGRAPRRIAGTLISRAKCDKCSEARLLGRANDRFGHSRAAIAGRRSANPGGVELNRLAVLHLQSGVDTGCVARRELDRNHAPLIPARAHGG